MKTNDEPIVVEQTFNSPVESVWDSLTDAQQMRKWYFNNIPVFKPEIGFETRFNVRSNDRNFLHKWKVTEAEHLKKLRYSWEYENYSGKGAVTFELFSQSKLTKLRLTFEILEDFSDDIPEFTRESGVAGWTYLINKGLRDFLESN